MSIYQKNLRRLGILLFAVSLLDLILELAFYNVILTSSFRFSRQIQTPWGIGCKDGIGLVIGALSCNLFYGKKYTGLIIKIMAVLLTALFPIILVSTRGTVVNRVDGLIHVTVILSSMAVYTALQLERSGRNWRRISSLEPSILDLKLSDVRQWFNPLEIGPKLELQQDISQVVNRFLETAKETRPLEITVRCPEEVSEPMQATMQEVFRMYYEDEEQSINSNLERLYIRVISLVVVSIFAMTIWIYFNPSDSEGVTWAILSNFAAFSLWQIGSTYFERSQGYATLLRAQVAKQAKLHFWASE